MTERRVAFAAILVACVVAVCAVVTTALRAAYLDGLSTGLDKCSEIFVKPRGGSR